MQEFLYLCSGQSARVGRKQVALASFHVVSPTRMHSRAQRLSRSSIVEKKSSRMQS